MKELLKEFLEERSTVIANTTRWQKTRLLIALERLLPDHESMLSFWIHLVLAGKDISRYVDEAPEAQREALFTVLTDLRGSERRRHLRKSSFIPVSVNGAHAGIVRNISVSGAFIRVFLPLSVSQEITVGFSRANQVGPTPITAEVVWTSPVGVGVRFQSWSKELHEMINAL
ncbi:MAG: PilZ domain-containing protein [Thermodesulfobacteriota bacterium]|nr:PilZ domain-containing protein [Thermodesulfobacteriota bacterium]